MNFDVANFLWIGGNLSYYEEKCIESFVKNNFKVSLYSYQHINVPNGVELKDARELISESEIYLYTQGGQKGSLAAFSDIFRYEIIKKSLGWWFDADVFCLRHVSDWVSLAKEKRTVLGWEEQGIVNGAVIFSSEKVFSDILDEKVKAAGYNFSWGEIGPKLITKIVFELGISKNLCKREDFYPVHHDNFDAMFTSAQKEYLIASIDGCYSVHLWNEFFSRMSIPKNVPPPKDSFLYWLLSRYSRNVQEIALPEKTFVALSATQDYKELKIFKNKVEKIIFMRIYRRISDFFKFF